MAEFADSLQVLLKHEGGYINNPADPGGETKYGISRKQYPDLDIAGLTPQDAGEIYRKDYWQPNRLTEIESQKIADAVLDAIVNHGQGVKIVQQALNLSGASLKTDNIMGTRTIMAINSADPDTFLKNYVKVRKDYYDSLIQKDPGLSQFRTGWFRRVDFFLPKNLTGTSTMLLLAGAAIAYWLFGRKKR